MNEYSFNPKSHCVFVLDEQKDSSRTGLSFMVSEHDKFVKPEQYDNRIKTAKKWASSNGKYHEIFVDNKPKSGFKVISKQTRFSTSNVLWRIAHPDGFIFEISSENFSEIIENCSIIDKEIIGNLFFNTAGFLYNENFELYKKQVKLMEDLANTKKSQSVDLTPGDIIEMKGICDYKSTTLEYLGKYHCITLNDTSSFLVHSFINTENESVIFYKKLDNIIRHEKVDGPKYTKDEAIQLISDKIVKCKIDFSLIKGTYKNQQEVLAVYQYPFKDSDIKIEYLPTVYELKYSNCVHRCSFKDVSTHNFYAYQDLAQHRYYNKDDNFYSSSLTDINSFRNIVVRCFPFENAKIITKDDKENFHLVKFVVDKPKKK